MGYRVNQYNNRSNRRKPGAEYKVIVAIFSALWWLISLPFKLIFKKRKNPGTMQRPENINLDREYVVAKWQEIEQLMQLSGASNFSRHNNIVAA